MDKELPINGLPVEMLLQIFQYANNRSVLVHVCRCWNLVIAKHHPCKEKIDEWDYIRDLLNGEYPNVIAWAINNRCPWTITSYIYAQKRQYTDVVESMVECRSGLDRTVHKTICAFAAKFGNLELLKWAVSKGYPHNKMICKWAVSDNYTHIVEWLNENNCPCNREYH